MKSTSPPTPVTANPVDTPGTLVRSAASKKNRARPNHVTTSSASMRTGASELPEAMAVATLRMTLPRVRSSERTPASRVWSATIVRSASSVTSTSSGRSPARSTWRPSRWWRAMATFSSST